VVLPAVMAIEPSEPPAQPPSGWLSLFVGVALLAAVIAAALRFSEERAFIRLAERAEPWWLMAALLLQAATYVAQGRTSATW